MPCLFAAFAICHRSHSPLCSLFQISKATKIQVKIAQLILSPLLNFATSLMGGSFLTAIGMRYCHVQIAHRSKAWLSLSGQRGTDVLHRPII